MGEMRDLETIETALTAAETGHLVMSHAAHAGRHGDHQPHHLRVPAVPAEAGAPPAGAACSRRWSSQRLVPRADGKGRVAAVEVLQAHRAREGAHRGQGPHQGDPGRHRAGPRDLRDADLRPVADVAGAATGSSPTRRRTARPPTRTTSRCASPASAAPRDSKWDDFDGKAGEAAAGARHPGLRPARRPRPRRGAAAAAPRVHAARPVAPAPGPAGSRSAPRRPAAPRPGGRRRRRAAGAAPAAPKPRGRRTTSRSSASTRVTALRGAHGVFVSQLRAQAHEPRGARPAPPWRAPAASRTSARERGPSCSSLQRPAASAVHHAPPGARG